jgi:hypothetical protein
LTQLGHAVSGIRVQPGGRHGDLTIRQLALDLTTSPTRGSVAVSRAPLRVGNLDL